MNAIELDPLNPEYHFEVGITLRASEDPLMLNEGLRHIYLATEIAPDEVKFLNALEEALSGEDLVQIRKIKDTLKRAEGAGRERRDPGGGGGSDGGGVEQD